MNLSINDKTEDQKNNNESKEKKEKQNNQNNSSNLSLTLSDISLANPDIKNTQEFEKNQKLCHFICVLSFNLMAGRERFELSSYGFGDRCFTN